MKTQSRSKKSRPKRFKGAMTELSLLSSEYAHWLHRMPENLLESELAIELEEAIEQLDEVIDMLTQIELPRGFGRQSKGGHF